MRRRVVGFAAAATIIAVMLTSTVASASSVTAPQVVTLLPSLNLDVP
jgi:hypothetical protein